MGSGHGPAVQWCRGLACEVPGEQLYGRWDEVDVEFVLLCLRYLWRIKGKMELRVWNSEIWAGDKDS